MNRLTARDKHGHAYYDFELNMLECFGDTVFKTEEEAEARLAELEGEK